MNIGYEDVCGVLQSFNGVDVISLAHLATLVDDAARAEPPVSVLESMLVTGELLVLDAAQVWETEEEIFATHSIPRRASFDVVDGAGPPTHAPVLPPLP